MRTRPSSRALLVAVTMARVPAVMRPSSAEVTSARHSSRPLRIRRNNSVPLATTAPTVAVRAEITPSSGAVVANGTELFRLIRKGRLEWRAEVTSAELGRITAGTRAIVTATSNARLEGRVRMIGPTVDPQSRVAIVYVDVTALPGPAAGSARAGMFAKGEFDLGAQPALTVPQQALVVREGFNYLMRVLPDNRVAQVKVQIGRIAGDRVEILSGVDGSARIVASGGGFLNDGDLVRVTNGNGAASAAATATAGAPPASAAAAKGKKQ